MTKEKSYKIGGKYKSHTRHKDTNFNNMFCC